MTRRKSRKKVFSPSSSVKTKTVQIEYKNIVCPIHWTRNEEGNLVIDQDLMRKEFENELGRILFLETIKPW